MKLLRLKLGVPFRSLPAGFELKFLRDDSLERCFEFHPYCLAGPNGSGKSNVLEALAAIFYHIDCIYLDPKPDGFEFDENENPNGFQATICNPNEFELEYLCPNDDLETVEPWPRFDDRPAAHILIKKVEGKRPEVHWLNRAEYEDTKKTQLFRAEVKMYLPRYILGYSSGQNEILSLPFFKMRFIHFDEYRHHLTKDLHYSGRPEGRMLYLDDRFSQIILLCHFLFPSAAILKVFREKIGITDIRRFRIIIRRHHRLDIDAERLKTMSSVELEDESETKVELTSKALGTRNDDKGKPFSQALIDKLTRCATCYYEDSSPYEDEFGSDLYLDYWVNDATREAFQFHFGEAVEGSPEYLMAAGALNLFHSLQTLFTLNYYMVSEAGKQTIYRSTSLYAKECVPTPSPHDCIIRLKDFEIVKEGASDQLSLRSLSDGEHQLIHTIGLCLLFRHQPCLFLLDEPETHLNPDWRASYVSTLRAALEVDAATKNVMREVLLTSHSPFIVSDCQRENVLVFKKDAANHVNCTRPDFQTFGASANAITIKVFGQTETIGDYAMTKLNGLRQRLDQDEDPDTLIEEANRILGDSVEKVLFINEALNRKEGN